MTISIIIPVYNVAPYLRECLDSVLAESDADVECICVDDGSTDGSAAILDEYAKCDSRLHVIHQDNAGVSAARNAALAALTGDWFAFVDGDDWVDVRTMLELVSKAEASGYDGVFVGEQGLMDFYGCVCNKFYRSSTFGHLRFLGGMRYREDFCFWIDAYWGVKARWLRTDAKYYHYRSREGSATSDVTPHAYHDLLFCYVYALGKMREHGVPFAKLSDVQVAWFRTRVSGAAHFALRNWRVLSAAERSDAIALIREINELAGQNLQSRLVSMMLYGRRIPGWVRCVDALWRIFNKIRCVL